MGVGELGKRTKIELTFDIKKDWDVFLCVFGELDGLERKR